MNFSATTMKLFAISSNGDEGHLLRDNFLDSAGNLHSGILFFKKKADAETECDSMNRMRKGMKLSECYSVVKTEDPDTGIYGKIIDGKQV